MKSEDVHRTPFAAHVEGNLGRGLPAQLAKQRHHVIHEARVPGVEQSVQSFAMPQKADVDSGAQDCCDPFHGMDRNPVHPSVLDPPDDTSRNIGEVSETRLRQPTAHPQSSQG